jgi:deoxycytidylate deaminase
LKIVDTPQLARHFSGERKNGRMVAACLIKAGDEMGAAGSSCSATHAEPTSELCLARGRERGAFLVADADPFNFAVAHSIANRIKRVAYEPEYVLDANPFEHLDQDTRHCL